MELTQQNRYKELQNQSYNLGEYSIVPIRADDRWSIMKWRNEQIYHLRQSRPLTAEDQNRYFENVVSKLFEAEQPSQLLFSYLRDNDCIGYGGLVHINRIDRNAEISFLVDTAIESTQFHKHWTVFLGLIERVAFGELRLHKIFTYAFDLRPNLYIALEQNNYVKDAVLNEHCFFQGKYIDVVIHSKIDRGIRLRPADAGDLQVTYVWAADPAIRKHSVSKDPITFDVHRNWFYGKLHSKMCFYYIAHTDEQVIGSVRFDIDADNVATISYLIDSKLHGKGLGKPMLFEAIKKLRAENGVTTFKGLVLNENKASIKVFENLGFEKLIIDEGKIEYLKKVAF